MPIKCHLSFGTCFKVTSSKVFWQLCLRTPKSRSNNSLSGFTMGQPAPIYMSPMRALISGNTIFDFGIHTHMVTSGYRANPTESPTITYTSLPQPHFIDRPAAVYSFKDQSLQNPQTLQHAYSSPDCSKSLC